MDTVYRQTLTARRLRGLKALHRGQKAFNLSRSGTKRAHPIGVNVALGHLAKITRRNELTSLSWLVEGFRC
jgi:hypothetical protein